MRLCAVVLTSFLFVCISGHSYEDKRCKCICPSPAVVLNTTGSTTQKLFIANVPPSLCNCDAVVLPQIGNEIKSREQEYCPRCDCKYESRNTTVIKVVVILVIWFVMLLLLYMLCLMLLDPITRRRVRMRRVEGTVESAQLLLEAENED